MPRFGFRTDFGWISLSGKELWWLVKFGVKAFVCIVAIYFTAGLGYAAYTYVSRVFTEISQWFSSTPPKSAGVVETPVATPVEQLSPPSPAPSAPVEAASPSSAKTESPHQTTATVVTPPREVSVTEAGTPAPVVRNESSVPKESGLPDRIAVDTEHRTADPGEKHLSIDQQYKIRLKSECNGNFFCGESLRWTLCEGKWTEDPPLGEKICRGASAGSKP